MKGTPESSQIIWLEQKVEEQAGKIEDLEEKIEELKGELSSANVQIDDLEDEVTVLRSDISDLEDKTIDNGNKAESKHIDMLVKFMMDNNFILGNGITMDSLLWELGWQIKQLKKHSNI